MTSYRRGSVGRSFISKTGLSNKCGFWLSLHRMHPHSFSNDRLPSRGYPVFSTDDGEFPRGRMCSFFPHTHRVESFKYHFPPTSEFGLCRLLLREEHIPYSHSPLDRESAREKDGGRDVWFGLRDCSKTFCSMQKTLHQTFVLWNRTVQSRTLQKGQDGKNLEDTK